MLLLQTNVHVGLYVPQRNACKFLTRAIPSLLCFYKLRMAFLVSEFFQMKFLALFFPFLIEQVECSPDGTGLQVFLCKLVELFDQLIIHLRSFVASIRHKHHHHELELELETVAC